MTHATGSGGTAKNLLNDALHFRGTVHPPVKGQHKQGPSVRAPGLGRRGTDRDPAISAAARDEPVKSSARQWFYSNGGFKVC